MFDIHRREGDGFQALLGSGPEGKPRFGQLQGPIKPVKKFDLEMLFKESNLAADRFATNHQFLAGRRKTEMAGRRLEGDQRVQWRKSVSKFLHVNILPRLTRDQFYARAKANVTDPIAQGEIAVK